MRPTAAGLAVWRSERLCLTCLAGGNFRFDFRLIFAEIIDRVPASRRTAKFSIFSTGRSQAMFNFVCDDHHDGLAIRAAIIFWHIGLESWVSSPDREFVRGSGASQNAFPIAALLIAFRPICSPPKGMGIIGKFNGDAGHRLMTMKAAFNRFLARFGQRPYFRSRGSGWYFAARVRRFLLSQRSFWHGSVGEWCSLR